MGRYHRNKWDDISKRGQISTPNEGVFINELLDVSYSFLKVMEKLSFKRCKFEKLTMIMLSCCYMLKGLKVLEARMTL